jgi:predicted DnaQ family exonuclease/DinG family helicase
MILTPEILETIKFDDFVILDLETTGLDPNNDRIIEIGALRFIDGKESGTFETLINPEIPIPDFITRLTGITDQKVQSAPRIDAVIQSLLEFISDSPLIGHQINFDTAFVEYLLRKENDDLSDWDNDKQRFKYLNNIRVDTLFLSRIFLPFLPRFRLSAVAAYFGIDLENAHRALDDARATGHIFLQLIERTFACNNQILRQIIRLLYKNSVRAKTFFQPILDYKINNNLDQSSEGLTEDLAYIHQYANIIGETVYQADPLEKELPLNLIDGEQIVHSLATGGKLEKTIENYEEREQQIEMAKLVSDTFNKSEFLIVEAGTGTGKSMAYLLPAVAWAAQNRDNRERIIISTNTKNLQEQLFFKDIPTVFKISEQKFKAVLLKGKTNYICLDKWKLTLIDMDQRLASQERTRILPLILWVEQTQTGDIAENNGFQLNQNWGLWSKLIAENNYCPGKSCKYYHECFLMKARNNAKQSDLVIVNHSLLFSDLVTDNSIIGDYHNVIFDEAHNMEKTAADFLGIRFNWWTFRNIYHKLYEEEPVKTGTLVQLEYRFSQPRLPDPVQQQMHNSLSRLKTECNHLKMISHQFFSELHQSLRNKYNKNNQSDNQFASSTGEEIKIRYQKNFNYFKQLFDLIEELKESLMNCKKRLADLLEVFGQLRENSFQFQDQLQRELISVETDIVTLYESFDFCLQADMEKYVYWLELVLREKSTDVTFNAVPLNIAELLKTKLFDHLRCAIFTSATLAVDGSMEYLKKRTGLDLVRDIPVKSIVLGSPFDYENQAVLAISNFMDDPRNNEFSRQLTDLIKETQMILPGGMLVLFTNYSTLNAIYQNLKLHFEAEKILLLAQGISGSRTNIINQFKEYVNSILFGTDSFWEGIDVPGEALELLFITKLPFDVPTEPLIAARMEQIKKDGGNPFYEYAIPEAIIKFRQGFGRLIRHKKDYGIVIVCDNRLSRMQYGHYFLKSLPVAAKIYQDKESMFSELKTWLKGKKRLATETPT